MAEPSGRSISDRLLPQGRKKAERSTTLDMTRGDTEKPIIINSGYRSPQLNKKIGGVAGSNHLTGCAVDIRVLGMEQLILKIRGCVKIGTPSNCGLEFYRNHHFECDVAAHVVYSATTCYCVLIGVFQSAEVVLVGFVQQVVGCYI